MDDIYSLYDAKAKFSAILAKVRRGRTVYVSYRGKPVAEIRPVGPPAGGLEERLDDLAGRGILVRPTAPRPPIRPVKKRAGALKRFLAERGE